MKALKLFVDYPYIFQPDLFVGNAIWHRFLARAEYTTTALVDHILDTEYNAIRTTGGLRFKSEADLLMFLLRFS